MDWDNRPALVVRAATPISPASRPSRNLTVPTAAGPPAAASPGTTAAARRPDAARSPPTRFSATNGSSESHDAALTSGTSSSVASARFLPQRSASWYGWADSAIPPTIPRERAWYLASRVTNPDASPSPSRNSTRSGRNSAETERNGPPCPAAPSADTARPSRHPPARTAASDDQRRSLPPNPPSPAPEDTPAAAARPPRRANPAALTSPTSCALRRRNRPLPAFEWRSAPGPAGAR